MSSAPNRSGDRYDLIVRGGRVVDPSQKLDMVADVGVVAGTVAIVQPSLAETAHADRVLDATDRLVTPGLVDLHTHCYWGGVPLGINADKIGPATGVTSWVDTGSAGAGNFEGFLYHVVRRSRVKIFPLLHVSHIGLVVVGAPGVGTGELYDYRHLDFTGLLRVAEQYRSEVFGLKVRASAGATGPNGDAALRFARAAADALDLPLMVHVGRPLPFLEDVLDYLKKGDIVTHCFTPFHGGVVDHQLRVKDAAREARSRGVLFDVGHGGGSFSFVVAEAAMDQGFPPDTISTDLHSRCLTRPAVDLPTTMAKFLALGMELSEVIARCTHKPADALALGVGTLRAGAAADIAVFQTEPNGPRLEDSAGVVRSAPLHLRPERTLVAGKVVEPAEDDRDEAMIESDIHLSRRGGG